jgi:hypothetical protein
MLFLEAITLYLLIEVVVGHLQSPAVDAVVQESPFEDKH